MSDPETAAARRFVEEAREVLRFLPDDFGFADPTVGQGPFAVWVTFKSATTGVRASFDTRDRVVEVFVVKLVDGKLPPYDETESTHYVGPVSLAVVAGREPPTKALRLRSLSGEEFRRVLWTSAEVIREFGDILRGDFRRFDQALLERREHIARLEEEYRRQLSHEGRRSLSRWFRRRRRNGRS